MQSFIVSEHMGEWPVALRELGGLMAGGQLKFRDSVAVSLDSAPEAFLRLVKGCIFGKQLVMLV